MIARPILRCLSLGFVEPRASSLTPQLSPPIAAIIDEGEVRLVSDRRSVDPEWRKVDDVSRPLVVVGAQPIVGSDCRVRKVDPYHLCSRAVRQGDGRRLA